MTLDALGEVRDAFFAVIENKEAYEKQYQAFRKLLLASCKDIPLSEITGCIDKIVVDGGKHFEVKWIISKNQDK